MHDSISRTMLGLLTGAVVAFAGCPAAKAADDEHRAAEAVSFYADPKVPDIAGVWLGTAMGIPGKGPASNSGRTSDGRPPVFWAPWPLPYTPDYQKIYDERVAATARGVALGDIGARCLPFGLPWQIVSKFYPDEIIEVPGAVVLFVFAYTPIVIWTDGRGHPKDLALSYNGHSVGYWVGDTLFVDTVGINATTLIDAARDPHSAKLHMKWTVQRVADNILHTHVTLYDTDAFTQPVTLTNIWVRTDRPMLDDQSCFEANQNVAPPRSAAGFTKF